MAKNDESKEQKKQSLFQKMTTTQNTKETMQTNKHLADHGKQLGGILDGLNAVVASVTSVRGAIDNLTNITASMAKVWDAQFDWERKEDKEDETRDKTAEIKAREEEFEDVNEPAPEPAGEPGWLSKLLAKMKPDDTGSFIEGLVMTVAGLATVFRDEIADLGGKIVDGYNSALNTFNSNLNPWIETLDEIKEQEASAKAEILEAQREGKAATTEQLRDLVAAQMKLEEVNKAQAELGRNLTVNEIDDISERIDKQLEDSKTYNRAKLDEIARGVEENKTLFVKADAERVKSLQDQINEQKELLANPDYDGIDWFNTDEDKAKWKAREEKKLADMQKQLEGAKATLAENAGSVTEEDIQSLMKDDEELQSLLKQREGLRAEIEGGMAYDQNMLEILEKQADDRIKEIQKGYDILRPENLEPKPATPAEQIKGSTDVLGEANQQIEKTQVTIGGISEEDYKNMDLSAYGVDVKPTNPSAGTTGGEVNTASKIIDASNQTAIAPTTVNAPTTTNNSSSVVNANKTTMVPPTASKTKSVQKKVYK